MIKTKTEILDYLENNTEDCADILSFLDLCTIMKSTQSDDLYLYNTKTLKLLPPFDEVVIKIRKRLFRQADAYTIYQALIIFKMEMRGDNIPLFPYTRFY